MRTVRGLPAAARLPEAEEPVGAAGAHIAAAERTSQAAPGEREEGGGGAYCAPNTAAAAVVVGAGAGEEEGYCGGALPVLAADGCGAPYPGGAAAMASAAIPA